MLGGHPAPWELMHGSLSGLPWLRDSGCRGSRWKGTFSDGRSFRGDSVTILSVVAVTVTALSS